LIGVVLTAAYLLTMVRRICQGADVIGPKLPILGDVTRHEAASWGPLVALIVLLGLWPGLVLQLVDPVMSGVGL
jgi:NADH-quinone oxidoreductase subunit M